MNKTHGEVIVVCMGSAIDCRVYMPMPTTDVL